MFSKRRMKRRHESVKNLRNLDHYSKLGEKDQKHQGTPSIIPASYGKVSHTRCLVVNATRTTSSHRSHFTRLVLLQLSPDQKDVEERLQIHQEVRFTLLHPRVPRFAPGKVTNNLGRAPRIARQGPLIRQASPGLHMANERAPRANREF